MPVLIKLKTKTKKKAKTKTKKKNHLNQLYDDDDDHDPFHQSHHKQQQFNSQTQSIQQSQSNSHLYSHSQIYSHSQLHTQSYSQTTNQIQISQNDGKEINKNFEFAKPFYLFKQIDRKNPVTCCLMTIVALIFGVCLIIPLYGDLLSSIMILRLLFSRRWL